MTLPGSLTRILEEDYNIKISKMEPVSGGSINHAAKLRSGRYRFFIKWNDSAPEDMFEKEAAGLKILRSADTGLVIPEVIAHRSPGKNTPGFLIMEYVDPQRGDGTASKNLGKELARLHNHKSDRFGLDHDNYIGSLCQSNTFHSSWISFFIHERIEPQLKMAVDSGKLEKKSTKHWENLSVQLVNIFPETRPSLLHGDLWGGNYFFNNKHQPVLIDPAVYYGHPEMELSFTTLFGGFSEQFYDVYAFEASLQPGFASRVDIYNLYPLLVHANLFGGHYVSQVESILNRF
jgi:protein-ribulosamine 3-kinase